MKVYLYLILFATLISCTNNAQHVSHVNAKDFAELIKKGDGVILDVRTSQEYSRGHINNSTLISIRDPQFQQKIGVLQKSKPIYIYCLSGARSRSVANYLIQNGFSKVYNLQRGLLDWQRSGYTLVKSENPMVSSEKTYSEEEFLEILSSNKIVLVDFHASWCAPCRKMAPIIEKTKMTYAGKAKIEKLDIEANESLKKKYKVEAIPGFVLFKEGKQVWQHTGLISYEELAEILNTYM